MNRNHKGLALARILVHTVWIVLAWQVSAQNFRFERQTMKEGLSQNTINCMLQDKKGLIWFGTQDGLNCWDGYTFTIYRNDPKDSTTLSDSYVWSIYQDGDGRLWVGTLSGLNLYDPPLKQFQRFHLTPKSQVPKGKGFNNSVRAITEGTEGRIAVGTYGGGLSLFDPETKKFELCQNDPKDPSSLSNNRVFDIYKDRDGQIWVATDGGGLNRFDVKTKKFDRYQNEPNNNKSLSNDRVYCVYQDRSGFLWVGTEGGLNKYDPATGAFERFNHNLEAPASLSDNHVNSIHEDQRSRLWVGTINGLNLLDPIKKSFRIFRNIPVDGASLSDNNIQSLIKTNSGQLIVGTYGGGINVLDVEAKKFSTFTHNPNSPSSLSNSLIWSIFQDRRGRLWVGTRNGLNLFNDADNTFENYRQHGRENFFFADKMVKSIAQDTSDKLWVCVFDEGLNIIDVEKKTTRSFRHNPKDPLSLPSNIVSTLFTDRRGNMWLGTNAGLGLFEPGTSTFKRFQHDPNNPFSLIGNKVNAIYEDSRSRLWIGTTSGLSVFDVATTTFKNYMPDPYDTTTLSSKYVYFSHEDRSGRLWVGTDNGLNLFDSKHGTFRALHYEEGFPNDVFYSILEDERGRLWCGSNNGILCFTPATDFAPDKGRWGEFRTYTSVDGIQNDEFTLGGHFKGLDGKMYFGGINGFTVFHPDSITDDVHVPPVLLTGLEIFNSPVLPGKDYKGFVMPVDISGVGELVLSYRESVFSIKFSALSFAQAWKNQYAYQLEGFDKDWNYTNAGRRIATYTNLDPGTYIFRVKASNRDGIWNETGATLKIVITPPWWGTWWFRTILAISSLGAVALAFIVHTKSIRKTNKLLTEAVEQKTKELKEKNQVLVEQEREILAQNEELLAQTTVLEEKNQELERAKGLLEIELQYQYQRQLLKMSIDVQENERKRIAQDLHDELGAVLSIARMQLVQMQNNLATPALSKGLQQAQAMTETALATMRRISHELMPPQLEKYGLIKTLEALAGQINSTKKVSINLTTPDSTPRWSMPVELGLYRIVMEMINNTLRHAEASHIHIQLLQTLQNIVFTYSDDGKGLPKNYIEGHGFKNIEARTNVLGGKIEIGKEDAIGFNATIYIPQTFFEPKTSATRISSEDHAK